MEWFGNLVTIKWWSELWLKEGFAMIMEFIAIDSIFPNWNVFEFFMHRFMTHVLPIDSLRMVQR